MEQKISKRRKINLVYNALIVACVVIGIIWIFSRFVHFGNIEYTNNAQVRQQLVPVNSRVQGFIKKIYFDEYTQVRKGDTLLVVDDAEYRLRLAQAEADYQNALVGKTAMGTSITTTHNNILVSDASIEEVRIRLENAERELRRYENLLKQDAVTVQQYDQVKTTYDATKAQYDRLTRQKQSTSLMKQEQTERLDQQDAMIKLAEAALEIARLNLSYTVILAPCDGVTGRKNIQEGQLIQPGQAMVNIVDESDLWIVANYKETQTANITEGAEVDIEVDAVPGVTFKGVVTSISQATGSSYSIIPQDNATGNFVKVEQRIPVRIALTASNDAAQVARLRAGMNVETTVKY